MPDRDDVVRAALERQRVPPERSAFLDELWELVQAREHAAAVRWRRISIVLAVVATAAVAAASVLAAPHAPGPVDQTVTCAVEQQGGLPALNVGLRARSPARGTKAYTYTYPAEVSVTTGGDAFYGAKLFLVQSSSKGYVLDRTACPDGGRRVALNAAGLSEHQTIGLGYRGLALRCLGPAHVTLRMRITQGSKGLPTHVLLAVANTRTGKQLAFVDWTVARVRESSSTACDVNEY